jgi:hypothetical protein
VIIAPREAQKCRQVVSGSLVFSFYLDQWVAFNYAGRSGRQTFHAPYGYMMSWPCPPVRIHPFQIFSFCILAGDYLAHVPRARIPAARQPFARLQDLQLQLLCRSFERLGRVVLDNTNPWPGKAAGPAAGLARSRGLYLSFLPSFEAGCIPRRETTRPRVDLSKFPSNNDLSSIGGG